MRIASLGLGYWKVKAVQCYLSMLIWLVILSIVLYYWILIRNGSNINVVSQSGNFGAQRNLDAVAQNAQILQKQSRRSTRSNVENQSSFAKETKEINVVDRLCNNIDNINQIDENIESPNYKLEAIIIIFRHGDRGPLNHIGHRNVSHIECRAKSFDFDQLQKFAMDNTLLQKIPGYSQFIGQFHTFPKVVNGPYCSLGQLSEKGAGQLLELGKVIRSAYSSALFNKTLTSTVASNEAVQSSHKVLAYSTRYRRTFQSLFAFLYGLFGPTQLIQNAAIYESQSITFCFKHCSCKAVDKLKKIANKKFRPNKSDRDAMNTLTHQINRVLGTEKSKKTGNSLLDSLLVYPCHNMQLPCHQHHENHKNTLLKNFSSHKNHQNSSMSPKCLQPEHLLNLVKLINQENEGLKKIPESQKFHMLSSYGLLKEIVDLALKMTSSTSISSALFDTWKKHPQTPQLVSSFTAFTSSNLHNSRNNMGGARNKIVVFSGHDVTIQSITAALGILSDHNDLHLPPFASRLIFEFYKNTNTDPHSPRKLYFRIIYNGISVTHLVKICQNNKTSKNQQLKLFLCPIEYLVRFLHENYFETFENATNFKDACKKSVGSYL